MPTYAPELHIDGAAIGGLTANVTLSALQLNGKDVAGLLVQALLGLTQQYTTQRNFFDNWLKREGPYNTSEFYSALNMNVLDSAAPLGLPEHLPVLQERR